MSRRALPLLLLLLLVCLRPPAGAGAAPAQQDAPVSAQATFDRSHATVGDPIGLTIAIRYSAGVQVKTNGIENQFDPFDVLSASPPVDKPGADGSGEIQLRYQLAAYQTGALQLPALSISYTLNGQTAVAQSQPLPVTIDSVIPPGDQATDIRPLKPQLDLPFPAAPALLRIVLAVLLLTAVLAVAVVVWRRRRTRVVVLPVPAPPMEPLEAEARAELDRIVEERYLARGDYRTHYALMAECIRRYITRRFGFPASALTTTELGDRMVQSGVGRWRARLVAGLLTECDAVHYAHYLPAPARAEADIQMAYEIVDMALSQETRPDEMRTEVGG